MVPEVAKKQLGSKHKQDRMEKARELLRYSEEQRQSMVFVDATKRYICGPDHRKVWVELLTPSAREQVVELPKFMYQKPIVLKWYAAIAPYHSLGVIHLATGTTGYPTDYHVRMPLAPAIAMRWQIFAGPQTVAIGGRKGIEGLAAGSRPLQVIKGHSVLE